MDERKIIHVDMDAFFAAVEQRDHPELLGKSIAVGFDGARGVVSTASYEARRYGVHSAQSIQLAKRLCKDLIIIPVNHSHYREVSYQVHEIFHDYTDLIEPISIDEAFLDVTKNKIGAELAADVAKEIKQRIRDELHLTASAGVSYNKFLAKVASDYHKPDGLCVIPPNKALDFISKLPVEKIWGVGPKTAARMHAMGIFNGAQLRQVSMHHLLDVFGKVGEVYYNFSRGIDERSVEAVSVRKSVGCERTFMEDLSLKSSVLIELYHTVLELVERVSKSEFEGKTLTLKIKYSDFKEVTRSVTVENVLKMKEDILPLSKLLLSQIGYSLNHSIRLIGLAVSNPRDEESLAKHPELVEGFLDFKE